ncbi:MAG: fimbrial protein [Pseudomonadota bacterium]
MKFRLLISLALMTFSILTVANAATSDTLLLRGTVALVNSIQVSPESKAVDLNILAGESGTKVAAVAETSNNLNGYIIQMSSSNGGQLRHSTEAAKKTTYQISYNGGSYVTPGTSPSTVKSVSSLNALTTNSSNVLINVTAYPTAVAGIYSDTVTFSIVAN